MYNDAVNPALTGVVFQNNIAGFGGGMYNAYGCSHELTDITFSGNSATTLGGGIYSAGEITLTECTLTGNQSLLGGGIYNDGTLGILTNTTLTGNSASQDGGGVYVGDMTVDASNINSNTAGFGGGIFNSGNGILTINAGTVSGNNATSNIGGGIYNQNGGIIAVGSSTISSNTAYSGAGIYNNGSLTIQNGTLIGGAVQGNVAYYDGGGIYNDADGATTIDCQFGQCQLSQLWGWDFQWRVADYPECYLNQR